MTPAGMDVAGAALVVGLALLVELAQTRSSRPVVLRLLLSVFWAPTVAILAAAGPHLSCLLARLRPS